MAAVAVARYGSRYGYRYSSAWATLQADPNFLLDKYRVDFCLMARESSMSRVLPLLPGWKKIYSDELSAVFARSAVSQ